MALARPDLRVTLIEPLLRRSEFLREVVDELGVDVRIVRGRAEGRARTSGGDGRGCLQGGGVAGQADQVEHAAAATGGRMLAIKGERAEDEIHEHRRVMTSLGAVDVRVMRCGADYLQPPATVVVAGRGAPLRRANRPDRAGRRRA